LATIVINETECKDCVFEGEQESHQQSIITRQIGETRDIYEAGVARIGSVGSKNAELVSIDVQIRCLMQVKLDQSLTRLFYLIAYS